MKRIPAINLPSRRSSRQRPPQPFAPQGARARRLGALAFRNGADLPANPYEIGNFRIAWRTGSLSEREATGQLEFSFGR
jgi:hypothetical protein